MSSAEKTSSLCFLKIGSQSSNSGVTMNIQHHATAAMADWVSARSFHKVRWNSAPAPSGCRDAVMVSPSGINVIYLRRIKAMTHAGSVEKAGLVGHRFAYFGRGIWCGMFQGVQISVTFPLRRRGFQVAPSLGGKDAQCIRPTSIPRD